MIGDYGFPSMNFTDISQNVTIVPRLSYSTDLLCKIIEILKEKRNLIKKSNQIILSEFDRESKQSQKALDIEKIIVFSIEILSQVQKSSGTITGITDLPKILPSTIPMIRTISAQLFDIAPECSQKLSELSVHLGSIALDSATLSKARFDFRLSNEESATLLDEVKLMVDSKINKQYPNLDFFKP